MSPRCQEPGCKNLTAKGREQCDHHAATTASPAEAIVDVVDTLRGVLRRVTAPDEKDLDVVTRHVQRVGNTTVQSIRLWHVISGPSSAELPAAIEDLIRQAEETLAMRRAADIEPQGKDASWTPTPASPDHVA